MTNKKLLKNPNKHAAKVVYRNFFGRCIYVGGYQTYLYLPVQKRALPYGRLLSRKSQILEKVYEGINVYEKIKSVLDIGSNNGYFLLQARYYGAQEMRGVDIDAAVLDLYNKKYMNGISCDLVDYQTIEKSYDLTIALSLTHWMLGQIAENEGVDKTSSLHTMFAKLAKITNYVAVIELVTSDDAYIVSHSHHDFTVTTEDYLSVAKEYFGNIEYLGSTRFSRHIYAFYL